MSNTKALSPGISDSRDCPACPGKPVLQRLATRDAVLGAGLTIRRALPNPERRMIGAWCFLDHAGPMAYGHGQGIKVGPHPHIGLQTFSWMIDGEIFHRDSLGTEQIIRRGQVNLMTAGRGIAHSEDAVNDDPGNLHLAQLWIALPDAVRHCDPAFEHFPDLPLINRDGFQLTVLAGDLLGHEAPGRFHTPLLGVDLQADAAAATQVPLRPDFEHGVLVLRGQATVEGEAIAPGTLLYLGTGRRDVQVSCTEPCQLLLLGGAPFEERILLWWNFVGRTQAEIEKATDDWNAGQGFGAVIGSPSPRLVAPDLTGLHLKTR